MPKKQCQGCGAAYWVRKASGSPRTRCEVCAPPAFRSECGKRRIGHAIGPRGLVVSNLEAAQRAVETLGDEPRYAGLREAALSLARVVDERPDNASLWREYINVLRDIWEAGRAGDDDLEAFLDGLAEMGNTAD